MVISLYRIYFGFFIELGIQCTIFFYILIKGKIYPIIPSEIYMENTDFSLLLGIKPSKYLAMPLFETDKRFPNKNKIN